MRDKVNAPGDGDGSFFISPFAISLLRCLNVKACTELRHLNI